MSVLVLCDCHKNIPIIYVFVIVFVSLHVDISSFLFIILNSLEVLLIICSLKSSYLLTKNVTSKLVAIVLGICV